MNGSTGIHPPFDPKPPRSLATVDLGEMAALLEIPVELARYAPSGSVLRRGEVVQCLGRESGTLTLARADGTRISIPERLGLLTPIQPFDPFGTDDLPNIDPSAERRAVPRIAYSRW